MIVSLAKLQLFVVGADTGSDRGRSVEIEWGTGNGSQFSSGNQTFVDGRELTGFDHELVPQDVAGSAVLQIEVGWCVRLM
jgi:hypothetical protein